MPGVALDTEAQISTAFICWHCTFCPGIPPPGRGVGVEVGGGMGVCVDDGVDVGVDGGMVGVAVDADEVDLLTAGR